MLKKSESVSTELKFVKTKKNPDYTVKTNTLVLPHLPSSGFQASTSRHGKIEARKLSTSRHKAQRIKANYSESPNSINSLAQNSIVSDLPVASKIDKNGLSLEVKKVRAGILTNGNTKILEEIKTMRHFNDKEESSGVIFFPLDTTETLKLPENNKKLLTNEAYDNEKTQEPQKKKDLDTHSFEKTKKYSEEKQKVKISQFDIVKKYKNLEEIYTKDTNMLKKKLEKKKYKLEMLKKEHSNFVNKYEDVNEKYKITLKELEETEAKNKSLMGEFQNKITEMTEKLITKEMELMHTTNSIQKIKHDKKKNEELQREYQEKTKSMLEANDSLKLELTSLKNLYQVLQSDLIAEKQKSALFDNTRLELISTKEAYSNLEENLKVSQQNLEFVSSNYREIQQKFSAFQEKALETENALKSTIDKINLSPGNIQFNGSIERSRSRKFSSISKGSNDSGQTDNFARLINKITKLEEKNLGLQQEVMKINQDLAYYKRILDEKNTFLAVMEKKIETQAEDCEDKAFNNCVGDILKYFKEYKQRLKRDADWGMCASCKSKSQKLGEFCSKKSISKNLCNTLSKCFECDTYKKVLGLKGIREVIMAFKNEYKSKSGQETRIE
ncbi:hypothetical protein SteCoe_35124 [Stentor coeruleus]|uniref:Uncharacterized protein n=1 Tax=Stentor coeruleus TaxID=5963 RepID=A0A1R2AT11_9CILI|nr:hypothetical protein SteCoe_35124 [Stentor coeruleus]